MKANALSSDDVEDAAIEALFRRGIRLRVWVIPFLFVSSMSVLALDPANWRRWVVLCAVTFAFGRLSFEVLHARRHGLQHTRLSRLVPVPITVALVVTATAGGIESPTLLMLPLLIIFPTMFLRPRFGLFFAIVASLLLITATWLAWKRSADSLIPMLFGGGPREARTDAMLFTRAAFGLIGVWLALLMGWIIRGAFRTAIARALQARDEVLANHDESMRSLTLLAGEIAHELKNPLASVKGLAALVDRDVEGKTKERVEVLRREVDRMQEILDSFLTFTRPLVPLSVDEVELRALVEQVAALHEGLADERDISLHIEGNPKTTARVDARKVKQVVMNLLQNALDVTPRGGVIELIIQSDARIRVMDRGPGITDVERVFISGVTTKPHGNGLGLPISRMLARQHGGELELKPREGGGTIAELVLQGVTG